MSSLASTPTTPSLDLFSDLDCSLLSESLSLSDTLSIMSLDSIPPFPFGCMVPLSTFLAVNDTTCTSSNSQQDKLSAITTTIPTPPRLRTLLKEDLCISKWTETLETFEAPGHIPWGEVQDHEFISWKPEGSLYSSDAFQHALSKSRQRNAPNNFSRTLSESSNSYHRNALVFEREITLNTEGRTKRWSVQVSAQSMNPEVVDMMVELRNLKSYFKGEEENEEGAETLKPQSPSADDVCVTVLPPSLFVSNSQHVIPLSLESAGSLDSAPKTLAMRRGHKSLTPLSLKPEAMDQTDYSSIPTAFLGSPSSYCPTFEFAGEKRSSTGFQDMIYSLRSQYASLQVKTPSCPAFQEESLASTEAVLSDQAGSVPVDEDEWAFADSLLEKFPEFCIERGLETCSTTAMVQTPFDILVSPDNVPPTENTLSVDGASGIPSDPSPASPSVASSVSPTLSANSPRGILKRCKSVRFAESPIVDQGLTGAMSLAQENSPINLSSVRHSVGPSPLRVLKRPSPLRHFYAPQCNSVLPLGPSPPFLRTADGQKPLAPKAPAPKSPVQPLKRAVTPKAPSQKRANTVPAPVKSMQKTLESSSLGRSFRNTLISGKENKKEKTVTSFSSNRHTMDENKLRRASTANPPDAQKSRMPVPLRNIFTRFK